MPTPTDVIQALTTPPIVALQQVLDTNGPFAAGNHVISQFHTDGAFLLPAGNHGVLGTYGVLTVARTIPASAGHVVGFNGSPNGQDRSEDYYADRICQIVNYRSLPITSALVPVQRVDVHFLMDMNLWSAFVGAAPDYVGLHVFPGWTVDLFWMCLL